MNLINAAQKSDQLVYGFRRGGIRDIKRAQNHVVVLPAVVGRVVSEEDLFFRECCPHGMGLRRCGGDGLLKRCFVHLERDRERGKVLVENRRQAVKIGDSCHQGAAVAAKVDVLKLR